MSFFFFAIKLDITHIQAPAPRARRGAAAGRRWAMDTRATVLVAWRTTVAASTPGKGFKCVSHKTKKNNYNNIFGA